MCVCVSVYVATESFVFVIGVSRMKTKATYPIGAPFFSFAFFFFNVI